MAQRAEHPFHSLEEYLALERASDIKHELVEGLIVAMSGATKRHNDISLNIAVALRQLKHPRCRIFAHDVKTHVSPRVVYYPDVVVSCDATDADPYLVASPCLVIEVLSPSTETTDRREKLVNYLRVPSLEACLLVSQDERRVEVYRRTASGEIVHEVVEGTTVVHLPCLDGALSLADVYEGVAFDPE